MPDILSKLLLAVALSLFIPGAENRPVWAQQFDFRYDSLAQVIRRPVEDTSKVQAYLDYATQFYYTGSDSAYYYVQKAKKLSAPYPKSASYAQCLKQEGDLNAIRGNFLQAIGPYQEGIEVATAGKHPLLLIKLLANLANTYKNLGRLDLAMRYTDRVTEAFEGHLHNRQDSIAYAFHHFQLFDIYRVQGFENDAIAYGEKGYRLSLPLHFDRGIGYGLYVQGLQTYRANPAEGLAYCQRAMEIAETHRIPDLQTYVRSLRAAIHIQTGQYRLAETELLQNRQYQANSIRLVTSSRLSRVYFHQGRFAEALREHRQALQLADTLGYRAELVETLENGILIYRGIGDFKTALHLLERLGRVKEDIASDVLKRDYQRLAIQYQASEKDRELAEKQLIIAQKDNRLHRQSWLVAGGALVLLLTVAFFWYSYQQQQRLQRQRMAALEANREVQTLEAMIQGEERERSRIAKDLHDGIGGLLSAVKMHFSTLQNEYPDLKNALTYANGLVLLDEASAEVRKTAHNLMPDMLSRFGLDEALHLFCQKIDTRGSLRLDYQTVGQIGRFPESFELAVYRMVQELVNNVLKHADATRALVQLSRQGDTLTISVEDDGKGFSPQATEKGAGLGLSSLKTRVDALGGTLEIDSEPGKGTAVYIELTACPLSQAYTEKLWIPSK